MTSQKFLWKAALAMAMGEAFLLPLTPFLCKNRLLDANTRVEGGRNGER